MTKFSGKLRVGVLMGGRSGEHEVSLRSAESVIQNLDPNRFEVIPILIDKSGKWSSQGQVMTPGVYPGSWSGIDVVFPVLHGTMGEDGTIQGLLELAEVPYVGSGVLASSLGMDKDLTKRLVAAAAIPIVPFLVLRNEHWKASRELYRDRVSRDFGFPCFVKPANTGSSVGVHKVKAVDSFDAAVEDAFRYDTKVLVEKAIPARELEIAVLENPDPSQEPIVSVVGEITPQHEFYSYEAKYIDSEGAKLVIPAPITSTESTYVQEIAAKVFRILECEGLARVDLFLDRENGKIYFNEINTMPGFTSISMYPKMMLASGIPYSDLLSRLVDLAVKRHARKSMLVREFHI